MSALDRVSEEPMEKHEAEKVLIEHGFDPDTLNADNHFHFLQACKEGKKELVEAVLDLEASFLGVRGSGSGEIVLVKAAEGGHPEILELLLARGADPEDRDNSGDTALQTAVNWKNLEAVRLLLARGATPNTINHRNWTPLSEAVHSGQSEIVDALLAGGADPNLGSELDAAPLSLALGVDASFPRRLLDAGADPEARFYPNQDTLLMRCCWDGHGETARLLVEHGADVRACNDAGWTAWMWAAVYGHAELLELLVEHGAERRDLRFVELLEAARHGYGDKVGSLLDEGLSPDVRDGRGRTPLVLAIGEGHVDVAELLLKAGADPNVPYDRDYAAVSVAAVQGNLEGLERLLAAGATANETAGRSIALTLAAANGHEDVVRRLLQAGANVDSTDPYHQTALFRAAGRGHTGVVSSLIESGADLEIADRTRPLLLATSNGRLECVRALLDAGADVNARDPLLGDTALIKVAGMGRHSGKPAAEMADALLLAGADYRLVTRKGLAALQAAIWSRGGALQAIERAHTSAWIPSGGRREYRADDHSEVEERLRRMADGELEADEVADWKAIAAEITSHELNAWIARGNLAAVRALIEAGCDPDRVADGTKPPLITAAGQPEPDIAHFLLDLGADASIEHDGATALMEAAGRGHLALVERLLAAGVDPNAVGGYHSTAMTRAAAEGRLKILEALVAAGAQVDLFRGGFTPLIRAAQSGQTEAAGWLLAHGADPNVRTANGETALDWAQKNHHEQIVALLADRTRLDVPDAAGRTPLFRAVVQGDAAAVRQLLDQGADPDRKDGNGITLRSAAALRPGIAVLLDVPVETLAPKRLGDGDAEIFRTLYRGAALDVTHIDLTGRNYRGDTPVHVAVARGAEPLLADLIAAGADVNAENELGETPRSLAAVPGSLTLDKILKNAGARINIDAQLGVYGRLERFSGAMSAGDLRAVDSLLDERVVCLHLVDAYRSPLTMAVLRGDQEMVRLLIAKGADVEVATLLATPLVAAVLSGDTEMLAALLEAGASPVTAAGNKTPLLAALGRARDRAARILLEAGAPLEISDEQLADLTLDGVLLLEDLAREKGDDELVLRAGRRADELVGA